MWLEISVRHIISDPPIGPKSNFLQTPKLQKKQFYYKQYNKLEDSKSTSQQTQ